jgi:hypothetical protein
MRPPLPGRHVGQRSALRFGRYLVQRCARLLVSQQLQLQVAQRLATRPQQLHPLLPQLFGERLDLKVCPR